VRPVLCTFRFIGHVGDCEKVDRIGLFQLNKGEHDVECSRLRRTGE